MAVAQLLGGDKPYEIPDVLGSSILPIPGGADANGGPKPTTVSDFNPLTPVAGQQGGGRTYDAAPAGFDQGKWMDPTYNSPKYQVSRIIGKYGHSRDGLRAALPEIQALFPGTTITADDLLNFGSNSYEGAPLGTIDVIGDVGGRNSPQWNVHGGGGGVASTGGGGGGGVDRYGQVGVNTQTGAQARWNASQGMWIDSNGQAIRDDAIRIPGLDLQAQNGGRIFDDPASQLLETIARFRMDGLMKPLANPAMERFLADASAMMAELRAPVYSEQEEKALRVKVFDQLERDKQTAIQQTRERLAAMGHGKESGTIPAAIDLVERHYAQLRAQRENELFTGTIQERQRRLTQALQISGQAATVATNEQNRQEGRQREAMTVAALFPQMSSQRLAQAMQALGGGADINSLFQNSLQLSAFDNQQQGQDAQMLAGIGEWLAEILAGRTA